jgi:ferredoxin
MKALRLEPHGEATNKKGMAIALDPGRCIGCGVCAHKCPTQSLGLVRRPQEQDFPMDFREQAFRMGKERGRFPLGPSPR